MEDSLYRISVKALIQDDAGRTLVVDTGGGWEMPGGGIDYGEEPLQGLDRELEEELGVRVLSIGKTPLTMLTNQATSGKREGKWCLWVVYEAKLADDAIVLSDKHHGSAWAYIDLQTMQTEKAHPNERALFAHLIQLGL